MTERTNENAPIFYDPDFMAGSIADFAFKRLSAPPDQGGPAWVRRGDTPRMEYYVNDVGVPYTYGKGLGVRTYEPQPTHPAIEAIRFWLNTEEMSRDIKFEVCFLNRYLDQSDQLGWHADDSPEMDDDRPIAIVTLGAVRDIMFRHKAMDEGIDWRQVPPKRLALGHGSLCLMMPGMQDHWEHRIPKAGRIVGERISLTFRGYKKP